MEWEHHRYHLYLQYKNNLFLIHMKVMEFGIKLFAFGIKLFAFGIKLFAFEWNVFSGK